MKEKIKLSLIITPEDMDRDDYIVYFHRRKAEIDRESQILYARDQGLQEGKRIEKDETAKNLLLIGLPIEQISQGTGLTIEKIQNLKQR